MKIAMIGQKGMPAIFGGVETHVHELSVRLVKRGHEVVVYNRPWYSGKIHKNIYGVKIKTLPSLHTKNFDTISHTLLCTLNAMVNKFDVIHYHGIGPAILSWVPKLLCPKTKVIVTFHSIDRNQQKWSWFAKMWLKIGEWMACHIPHQTIVVSKSLKQYVTENYKKETDYIPNGVPEYEAEKKSNLIDGWNIESKKYMVAVARLIPLKSIHTLIESFQEIKRDNPNILDNKKLVIVGDGANTDEYVQRLKQMAKGDSDIIFTGFQSGDTLHQLYSHASMLVHPSTSEGLPITVLEAMAYGLPTLVSNIPGHKEIITDSEYIFEVGNKQSLVEKLTNILQKNDEELEQTGSKNRDIVIEHYNWKDVVDNTAKLYQDN